MKTQKVGLSLMFDSSNTISLSYLPLAPNKIKSYWAMTDKTSILILLNSSKQHQAPAAAKPLKKLAIILISIVGEQLKTTHCLARAFARSLVDSVLPVPAGPAGAPPRSSLSAPISVI